LRDHTHWSKVAWIPFVSPPLKASDIVANVLLYVPFGYFGAKTLSWLPLKIAAETRIPTWQWLAPLTAAALLSLATETVQLYSHRRFPSATDLTCNIAGSTLGLYFAHPSRRRVRLRLSEEISS
jgi:glycopeptide antibiotics resistance protein